MKNQFYLSLLFFLCLVNMGKAQYDEYMKVVAKPPTTAFVMFADNSGNLYYVHHASGYLDLMKYDVAKDKVSIIADNFIDDRYENRQYYNNGFGAIATTKNRDTVYCMTTAGTNHGGADIFRLIPGTDEFEHIAVTCGDNLWMIWNLSLSPDSKALYYVANNVESGKSICKIDLGTKECSKVLNIDNIVGDRELCFGGINAWDKLNNFYVPVFTNLKDDDDTGILQVHVGSEGVSAKLLHFTDNLLETGKKLFPGFKHESCWDAICTSSKGNVYICVSNHSQPRDASQLHGNVAIYKFDPVGNEMTLLGDIKSISESVDNWMEDESQYKVHTFMIENADGKIYFATGEHDPTYFLRGSHIYTIDIETDEVADFSKTQPYLMKRDRSVIENTGEASMTSGVFIEHYGIKGIALNPNAPGYFYAMTWEMSRGRYLQTYIVRYSLDAREVTAMHGIHQSKGLHVYPAPFVDQVHFDLTGLGAGQKAPLNIYDMQGRLVFSKTLETGGIAAIAMPNQASGILFYNIKANGGIIKGKLIKE